MRRWYIVQTRARAEEKAVVNLRNQGFEVYLPQYSKTRRHARRVEHIKAPLFPRYLFVKFDETVERWRSINGTYGVSGLVSFGDEPASVPSEIIAEIQSREDDNGLISIAKNFKVGEALKIVDGALSGCVGLFAEIADDKRVILLLQLLGRQMKVAIPAHGVTPAS